MGIKEEITKIAVEQGYEGAKPKSIAQAIDALTDTLAGEDVKSGRSVVDAIRKYAPYVGSGGGKKRVELFNETVTTEGSGGMNRGLVLGNGTTADEVYVTFDGTEYELPRIQFPGGDDYGYGAFGETGPDFSTYPLMLSYSEEGEGWFVFTETAGTHTIVAYTVSGGGGGTTLGELQAMPKTTGSQPRVGRAIEDQESLSVVEMRVGSQAVFGNPFDDPAFTYGAAAGVTVVASVDVNQIEDISTYLATETENDENNLVIETLEDFDLDVSVDSNYGTISFVMPEWNADEGQFPIMYIKRGVV